MRWNAIHFIACVSIIGVVVPVQAKSEARSGRDPMRTQANCDLTGYKSETQGFTPPVIIPDNSEPPVTVGPIVTPADNSNIGNVVVELQMSHTLLGDVIATVSYDANCDGSTEASAVIMGRIGRTASQGCFPGEFPFGCESSLSCNNTYKFDDSASVSMGLDAAGNCISQGAVLPSGCFKPTGPCATPLAAFRGYRKGGCWYLSVRDMSFGDHGTICRWTIHILNDRIVGIETLPWTNIKRLYD